MIAAKSFCEAARLAGFSLYTGVPCSYLTPLINFVIDAPDLTYIGATNEGDAVAIATGAELAGQPAIVMMQNSGLGNAVSPLTSLNAVFGVPVLLVVTLRGEPGGPADEIQHALMGAITTQILETMNVSWSWFPRAESEIVAALDQAVSHMTKTGLPFCLVMKRDSVAPHPLSARRMTRETSNRSIEESAAPRVIDSRAAAHGTPRPARQDVLRAVQRATVATDVVVATTGYTSRELYTCDDRPNQLYVVGSMGCASSVALGMARARPDRRIVVLDGDGAMLMRLGALATIAYQRPPNLVHVLLDNEAHESTGGQPTVSDSTDLAGVARACGYPAVQRLETAAQLEASLRDRRLGLRLLHIKTRHGVPADLPRPQVTPREVAGRIRRVFRAESAPRPLASER